MVATSLRDHTLIPISRLCRATREKRCWFASIAAPSLRDAGHLVGKAHPTLKRGAKERCAWRREPQRSRLWQTNIDMNPLSVLQSWNLSQCDGDWEHQYGVKIETLDNPGWSLKIDLCGTDAKDRTFDRTRIERTEDDRISCWVEKNEFNAAMGPQNLAEGIETFLRWFENSN
jgi:hypothetical protein